MVTSGRNADPAGEQLRRVADGASASSTCCPMMAARRYDTDPAGERRRRRQVGTQSMFPLLRFMAYCAPKSNPRSSFLAWLWQPAGPSTACLHSRPQPHPSHSLRSFYCPLTASVGNLCCPSVASASEVVVSSSMFGKVHTRSLLILQMTCIGSSGFVTELVVYVKSGRFINDLVVYVKGQPSGSFWSSIQDWRLCEPIGNCSFNYRGRGAIRSWLDLSSLSQHVELMSFSIYATMRPMFSFLDFGINNQLELP